MFSEDDEDVRKAGEKLFRCLFGRAHIGTLVAVTHLEYHGQIATSICIPISLVFVFLYSRLYLCLDLYSIEMMMLMVTLEGM